MVGEEVIDVLGFTIPVVTVTVSKNASGWSMTITLALTML